MTDSQVLSVRRKLPRRRGLFVLLLGGALAASAQEPSAQQRGAAAAATAQQAGVCRDAQPFWWEVGDAHGRLAGGAVGAGAPASSTLMGIASASKWIYAAWVAEQRQGQLDDQDLRFLRFQSGYTRFHGCRPDQTVAGCLASLRNGFGRRDSATEGKFDYNGGHMQKHATLMGLGDDDAAQLGAAIRQGLSVLGPDWRLNYWQPQLAGGGVSSADDYGRFLRALLLGQLKLGSLLGSQAVCTQPAACPDRAVHTPIPAQESWHYSIGHWVEDDPAMGDGAVSSPGAFGFYPWIDAGRRFYGILARQSHEGLLAGLDELRPGVRSVACGRAIRAAWETGQARP